MMHLLATTVMLKPSEWMEVENFFELCEVFCFAHESIEINISLSSVR